MIILITIGLLMANLSFAKIEPEDIQSGHVWLFEDGATEDSTRNQSDAIRLPDSAHINSGGPWTNRTVKIIFNCADVSKNGKQTIFEEGGRTRGLVIYVFDGDLYVGAWNRSEYNWNGEWISAPIKSDKWYEVAAILRDTKGAVEKDKFEMWLDGKLIDKRSGGQLHGHSDDNGIGMTNQNTVFHDEDGSGTNRDYFGGLIDEVWVINQALTAADLKPAKLSVEPIGKLTATWGRMKVER
jgi:hypothetical protein